MPAGFQAIPRRFRVDAPDASAEQLATLAERTERSGTVYQTLASPPPVKTTWASGAAGA